MTHRNSLFDSFIVGFTLFAMFFGAGNLIFPSFIGYYSSSQWPLSLLGFSLTIILSLFGLLAFNRCGSIEAFGHSVGVTFTKVYTALILIVVASLLALPRTAATTYELAIRPFTTVVPDTIFYILYFFITFILTISKSKMFDYIGKILTPLLLLLISYLFIKGLWKYEAIFSTSTIEKPFSYGFISGYQTMDALASTVQANLAISAIVAYGYTSRKDREKILFRAGFIATAALVSVYAGLLILGSFYSGVISSNLDETGILSAIFIEVLGPQSAVILAFIVAIACITTSSGLVAMTADYFAQIFPKVNYRLLVALLCFIAIFIAKLGVSVIIIIAAPVLGLLYPVQINLILLNFFNKNKIFSPLVFRATVYSGLTVNFLDFFYNYFNLTFLGPFYMMIPFSDLGFIWLIPATLAFSIAFIVQIFLNLNGKKHLR